MKFIARIKKVFGQKEEEEVVVPVKRVVKSRKRGRDLPSCIYRKGNRFVVQKKIKGRDYYFGSFVCLDDAVKRKYDLEAVGWDKTKL